MMGSKDGVPVGSRELYLYKPPLNSWTWGKPDKTFDLPAYHLWILSIHLTRYLTVFYRSSSSRAPPPLTNCLSSTALSDTEAEDRLEPVLSFPDGFNMLLLPGNASEAKAKPLHSRYVLFWVKREEMLEQWARRSFNLLSQLGSTGIPNFLVICELDFLSTLLSHSLLITSSSESAPLHPGSQVHCGMMSLVPSTWTQSHEEGGCGTTMQSGWVIIRGRWLSTCMHWASSQRPQGEEMASLTTDATQGSNLIYSIKTMSVLFRYINVSF